MANTVVVGLNQQQLELLDDAVTRLGVPSRAEAIRAALREHAEDLLERVAEDAGKEQT
jgi:metal-responsive CopG/Arc/MetJ family transcriptional regulator